MPEYKVKCIKCKRFMLNNTMRYNSFCRGYICRDKEKCGEFEMKNPRGKQK